MIAFDQNRPIDVALIGRVTIDINPQDFTKSFSENTLFLKYVGGSPANTAVGLAKLGLRPGFIGKTSADSLGDYVFGYLKDNGVDTSCLTRCTNGECIGLAFTEIRSDGSTNLMMYRNGPVADLQLAPEDIFEDYIAKAKCLVLSGTALAAQPSREAALKALLIAKRMGTKIVFDIDYRPQTWKNADEVAVYYTIAAQYADMIMGSREEFDRMDRIAAPGMDDFQTAAHWFAQGVDMLIIKHGKQGSYGYCADGKTYRVLPFPVSFLKATGGGDAYSSAFLYGLITGKPIARCLELGTASASIVVASNNCSDALPNLETLEGFIEEQHQKGNFAVYEV